MEMTAILIAAAIIIVLRLPKWRRENREHRQYMDALDREREMIEDPDYWKAHEVVTGWDRDYVYNKFGHHIRTDFGGDQTRMRVEERKKMWEDLRNEWIQKHNN